MEIERRFLEETEIRLEGDTKPKITGYAAIFDTWTDIGGMFKESIAKGAFKRTINNGDVRGLWNHDANYVLGRKKANTLTLKEDDIGLRYEILPPDTQWARDLMVSIQRGDVDQSSYGFRVVQSDDNYDDNTRILREVNLFDVSPVTYPAEASTTSEVRSAFKKAIPDNKTQEERDLVEIAEKLENIFTKLRTGDALSDDEATLLRECLPVSDPAPSHSDTINPVKRHLIGTTEELIARYQILTTKNKEI